MSDTPALLSSQWLISEKFFDEYLLKVGNFYTDQSEFLIMSVFVIDRAAMKIYSSQILMQPTGSNKVWMHVHQQRTFRVVNK